MTAGAKIVAALGLILMLAAGSVVATQGSRLAALRTQATEVVWLGPDELARISEAYLRPHLLAHLDRVPTVRWVGWNDRRRTLTEPPRRKERMRWALGLMGVPLALGLLRALWGLAPWLWFLIRGVGRLTPGTTAGSARWATAREATRDLGPRFALLRRLGLVRGEPPFVVGRVGRRAVSLSAKRQGLNILAVGVPGEGKCLAEGTAVMMHDGAIKAVEDILCGDTLMGPGGNPRKVMSLTSGRDQMFKITPVKGEPWVCNSAHILTLVDSLSGHVYDMRLDDHLKGRGSRRFEKAKLFRTSIECPPRAVFDPYLIGLWLGDGTRTKPQITTNEPAIRDYCMAAAERMGLNYRETYVPAKHSYTVSLSVNLADSRQGNSALRQFRLHVDERGDKRIGRDYLMNSREVRLSLLAGLLDTDGCLSNNCADITTKFDGLKDDLLFLARSLGFAATVRSKESSIKSLNFTGDYWRIRISGDLSVIPCGVLRPQPRRQVKNVLRTGFTVEPVDEGAYYGFTLDGDGRFLLSDFTVTHNSSAIVIPNLLREGRGGRPRRSLVVADPKGECHAAAAGALSGAGYTVTRLDFYDAKGAGYNPLAHVHTASQALVFARAWIANTRGQGEVGASAEFWDSTVALLLQAAVLHLNHQYRARGAQAAPLARLLALFNVEDFALLKEELLHSPCLEAADAVRGFLGGIEKNERLGGSILVGLLVKFAVLHDPAVARVTAHDALDFRAMGDPTTAPLALFVILTPGMEEVLRPLTGCLFMQLFDALVAAANARPGQALGRRVFCYLDEVGTVGVIAGLPRRLATLRSAGVGLLLAVQDTIQLDTLYLPEGRRLITSTCQTHIIFAGVGQEDAAWVSTRLGTATVVGRSASAGREREELLVGSGGYNRAEVGRPLMTPEEIQQLPEGSIIVNALHARPVLARTLPWYQARGLRRLVARTAAPPSGGIASFFKQQAITPTTPDEDDNALAG